MASEKGLAEQLVQVESELAELEQEERSFLRRKTEKHNAIDRMKKQLGELVGPNQRTRNIIVPIGNGQGRLVRVEYVPKAELAAYTRVTVEPVEVV